MGWWLGDMWTSDRTLAVSWVFWVIVSITLHELGHGFTAIRCGDDTPRVLRRMTLNPLVHIPPFAWLLFALVGITWGLMPVNPSNFRRRYDDAKVAAAGPAVNFALFVICAIAAAIWIDKVVGVPDPLYGNIRTFLLVGTGLNIALMAFNLLPVPPLDGEKILSDFVPAYGRIWFGPNGQIIGLVAFALVFFVIGKRLAAWVMGMAFEFVGWLVGVI